MFFPNGNDRASISGYSCKKLLKTNLWKYTTEKSIEDDDYFYTKNESFLDRAIITCLKDMKIPHIDEANHISVKEDDFLVNILDLPPRTVPTVKGKDPFSELLKVFNESEYRIMVLKRNIQNNVFEEVMFNELTGKYLALNVRKWDGSELRKERTSSIIRSLRILEIECTFIDNFVCSIVDKPSLSIAISEFEYLNKIQNKSYTSSYDINKQLKIRPRQKLIDKKLKTSGDLVTHKCRTCGHETVSVLQPSFCSICSSSTFSIINNRSKDSELDFVEVVVNAFYYPIFPGVIQRERPNKEVSYHRYRRSVNFTDRVIRQGDDFEIVRIQPNISYPLKVPFEDWRSIDTEKLSMAIAKVDNYATMIDLIEDHSNI